MKTTKRLFWVLSRIEKLAKSLQIKPDENKEREISRLLNEYKNRKIFSTD